MLYLEIIYITNSKKVMERGGANISQLILRGLCIFVKQTHTHRDPFSPETRENHGSIICRESGIVPF